MGTIEVEDFEHKMAENLPRELDVLRGLWLEFVCVIKEDLQSHFDNCGLGCFSLLGFGLLFEEKKGSEKVNLLLPLHR